MTKSTHGARPRRGPPPLFAPPPPPLRRAAADADLQRAALALELAQLAEAREDFVLRLLADRAGIEQDQPRLALVLDARVAAELERAGEPLAVEIIHLTAPGFDEVGVFHEKRLGISD